MTKKTNQTIEIGGKIYDAETGGLIKVTSPQLDVVPLRNSKIASRHIKKSQTLNRTFVKQPHSTKQQPQVILKQSARLKHTAQVNRTETDKTIRQQNFKSRQIRHFMTVDEARALNSNQPVILSETINPPEVISAEVNQQFKQIIANARKTDFFTRYRMNQIARQRRQRELEALRQVERAFVGETQALPTVSDQAQRNINKITKNQALTQAIANAPCEQMNFKPKVSFFKRHASLLASTLAIILLGGYLTYLNMPNLSLRIAAAQAGINATYPDYKPTGYAIQKLASYENYKVVMEYKNRNNDRYTLTQQASNWDSKTILENIVKKQAGESYNTDQTKGLTIYTYNNQATWINGGILYNLTFNQNLSVDQIHKIATSL